MQAIALLLCSTLTLLAGAAIAPSMVDMADYLGQQNLPPWMGEQLQFWVNLVLTIPGLSIALAAPWVGHWLDRHQKRPLLLAALAGFSLFGCAGLWLMDSIWGLLLSRALLGVTVAIVMVTATTLVGAYYQGPAQSRFMGLMASFSGFGGMALVAIAGLMATVDFRLPFWLYLAGVLILPIAWIGLKEPAPLPASSANQPKVKGSSKAQLGWIAMAFVEAAMLYVMVTLVPFWLSDQHGEVANWHTGLLISTLLACMSSLALGYGWLSRRVGFANLAAVGWALLALGLFTLLMSRSLVGLYGAMALVGFGFGVLRPNLMVWILATTAAQLRGRTISLVTMAFFLGQLATPFLTLPLVSQYGNGLAFESALVLSLAMAVGIALINRTPVQATSQG